MVIWSSLNRLLNLLWCKLLQEGYVTCLLQRFTWQSTIALSTFDQDVPNWNHYQIVINVSRLFQRGSRRLIGSYWLCPTSEAIRHSMLELRRFSLTREHPSSLAPHGISSHLHVISYWHSSTWIVCRSIAVDVSSSTYLCLVSVVENDWHLITLKDNSQGQDYCVIKSDRS